MTNVPALSGEILAPATVPTAPLPAKGEGGPNAKVGRKTRVALDALVSGAADTITEAAAHAGMTREQLSRNLKKPHVSAYLTQLREAKRSLSVTRAEAELDRLTTGARSEYVRLEAAKHTIDRYDRLNDLIGRGATSVHFHIDLG